MLVGIVSGLVVAAIFGAAGWAWKRTDGRTVARRLRESQRRHQWEPLNDPDDEPGGLVFISPSGDERCVRCNARRWSGVGA